MKQIKTVYDRTADTFDKEVNTALAEGWTLVRRDFDAQGFIAELEKEVITEAERCCENCAHYFLSGNQEPCLSCSETASEWEPRE